MGVITINSAAVELNPEVNVIASSLFDLVGFGASVDLNVQAGDTLAVAIISAYSSLGTTTVTDSEGVTWTKYGVGPNRQEIWYTTDLATTGTRTVSCTSDGTFYGYITAFTMINSGGLAGTNTANTENANTTISNTYTTTAAAIIISSFFTSRGGEVGPSNELTPVSYGTLQIVEITDGVDGSGGPPDLRLTVTSEYKNSAVGDAQSFTNSAANDDKDILCFSILKL
jgi:hypothetical protein